jgi:adenylosuccinate lyase
MIERYTHKKLAKIWTEENKFKIWLEIELAVCKALEELGKIPSGVTKRIRKNSIIDLKRILTLEEVTKHEVVAFVNSIIEKNKKDGAYFHFGITSSDIMDTAYSIMLRDSIEVILEEVEALIKSIEKKAKEYKDVVCVGRTHGIHAEPMSFGLKFIHFLDELKRNKKRLIKAKKDVSVCIVSGAVGTFTSLEPKVEKIVAEKLGLHTIGITSQVVPRDIYAESFMAFSLCAGFIERVAVELRHLQRTEVMEVMEEFSKGQTGSSAMPHKRNPISAENLTGCARVIRNFSHVSLENIALWHERDISHSSTERIIGPDVTILLAYMLKRLNALIGRLKINESGINKNLNITNGLIYSSVLLVSLMEKGLIRDKAYKIVQKNAMLLWEEIEKGKDLSFIDILKKDKDVINLIGEKGLEKVFSTKHVLRHVDKIYKKVL